MHLFSRNDAPIGERPETIIALVPGASTIFSEALTVPEVGTSVPLGMAVIFPLTSLVSLHPEMSIGTPAFCATDISIYSFAGSIEPAPET